MSFFMRLLDQFRGFFSGSEPEPESSRGQQPSATEKHEAELELWSLVTGYQVVDVQAEGGRVMVLTTRYPFWLPVDEILKRENGEV